MMNMNRVTLLGNVGRDPEVRTLNNGTKAASFALATTARWKDRGGKRVEHTEWHRVVAYGAPAEVAEKRVRKGAALLVEGRLATREYRGRDGIERTFTEIVVAAPRGVVNILGPGGQQATVASGEEKGGGERPEPAADGDPASMTTGDWI